MNLDLQQEKTRRWAKGEAIDWPDTEISSQWKIYIHGKEYIAGDGKMIQRLEKVEDQNN